MSLYGLFTGKIRDKISKLYFCILPRVKFFKFPKENGKRAQIYVIQLLMIQDYIFPGIN